MTKKQPLYKVLYKTLSFGVKNVPLYFFMFLFICLAVSITNFLSIIVLQVMFDSATKAVILGVWDNTICYILIVLVIFIINSSFLRLQEHIKWLYFMKYMNKILKGNNAKAGRIPLINFESVELYENISLATSGVRYALNSTIDFINGLIFYTTFFGGLCIYLSSIKPSLGVVCLFCFVPQLFSQLYRSNKYYDLREQTVSTIREKDYYRDCLIEKEFYKETKTLNAKDFFLGRYREKNKLYNSLSWKTEKAIAKKDLLLTSFTFLGYLSSFLMLGYFLVRGDISLGTFASVFYSLNKLMDYMKEMIEIYGSMYQNTSLAGRLYYFLDLPEMVGKNIELNFKRDITLKNVTFVYPNSDKPAVCNVSLHIKNGEHLAIVGLNGSGKTTLVKLITGLFSPTQGVVLHDNNDISKINPNSIYKGISAVFQKFGKYKLSLHDNILLSDSQNSFDINKAKKVLEQAGFNFEKRPVEGDLDIMLSCEFNGIELSGGEWQRLAIARGLYRQNGIIVFDEPTAAIDPIEEASIYNRFEVLSKNKTALTVTHRLGSVKNADRIIVMKDGCIVEEGTHDTLIKSNGLYAEMFESQMQWYKR